MADEHQGTAMFGGALEQQRDCVVGVRAHQDVLNVDHARTAGADEVIETRRIGFSMIAHAVAYHGTATTMSRVLLTGAQDPDDPGGAGVNPFLLATGAGAPGPASDAPRPAEGRAGANSGPARPGSPALAGAPPVPEEERLAGVIASGSLFAVIGLFFGLGLLLAFTPCVLPMVPILSGLIIGRRMAIPEPIAGQFSAFVERNVDALVPRLLEGVACNPAVREVALGHRHAAQVHALERARLRALTEDEFRAATADVQHQAQTLFGRQAVRHSLVYQASLFKARDDVDRVSQRGFGFGHEAGILASAADGTGPGCPDASGMHIAQAFAETRQAIDCPRPRRCG